MEPSPYAVKRGVLAEEMNLRYLPRCSNASAFSQQGYMDTLAPLVAMHHHDLACA